MPLPAPLPLWARWIIQITPIVYPWIYEYIENYLESDPEPIEWRRVQMVYTRTAPSGYGEDVATTKLDIVNITAGAVDTTWTTTDYTDVETILGTWWGSVKALVSANHTLKEYRWYKMQFAPPTPGVTDPKDDVPYIPSLYPQRVTTVGAVGTNAVSSYLPYQVAATLTLKTQLPKHWGRIYVPGISGSYVDTNGRWTAGFVTSFSTAASTMFTSLQAKEMYVAVPNLQLRKMIARGLLGVTSIQVDNIPDIQRRRRPSSPNIRTVLP